MPAPKKYDEETMARAVRMYRDRVAEGGTTQLGARRQVGEMLGIKPATLRNWVRREDGPINDSDTSGQDGESLEAANARLRVINRRLYGQHKLWKSARRAEIVRGRDQVARLMGLASINGVRRGKRSTVTTRRDETAPRHPDHIKRAWATPTRPDQWWVADFTYVWTLAGFVYVSFITDVYSRRILGWRVMTFKATPLVLSALEQAVFTRRRHSAQGGFEFTTTGPVHHSDAGSQGEIKWSSQHLEHGGVACRQQSWSRKVVVGSRPRIGRSGRGCAPRVGHRPPGRPSAARD